MQYLAYALSLSFISGAALAAPAGQVKVCLSKADSADAAGTVILMRGSQFYSGGDQRGGQDSNLSMAVAVTDDVTVERGKCTTAVAESIAYMGGGANTLPPLGRVFTSMNTGATATVVGEFRQVH